MSHKAKTLNILKPAETKTIKKKPKMYNFQPKIFKPQILVFIILQRCVLTHEIYENIVENTQPEPVSQDAKRF